MKRFPFGLTIAATLAFTVLIGLGVWQLHRLAWKQDLLARVAALRATPARPIGDILALAARGGDVEYRRVAADCAPAPANSTRHDAYRYALHDGQVGWRLITLCRLARQPPSQLPSQPFDSVLVDRGLVSQFTGAMAPGVADLPPPGAVIGILRAPGGKPLLGPAETAAAQGVRVYRVLDRDALRRLAADNGASRPAPYILAVESERPAAQGLVPAALPQDIPNNHFVYALTWFALAGVLAWFYGALLIGRLNGR